MISELVTLVEISCTKTKRSQTLPGKQNTWQMNIWQLNLIICVVLIASILLSSSELRETLMTFILSGFRRLGYFPTFFSTVTSSRTEFANRRNMSTVKYLTQKEAISVDEELFNEYKFSVDQLMELAGLSVSTVVHKIYFETFGNSPVLALAGPGNNGGDAMVAARHLKQFGFQNVTLLTARKPTKDLFLNLIHQAEQSGVNVTFDPQPYLTEKPALVIDGLFGFSFRPPVRPDFQPFMTILLSSPTVLSIDIPSGWDVENGPPSNDALMPDALVSLTAPKKCASWFKGNHHFLGGRFVPPKLQQKYSLNLPSFSGADCIAKL